jgi:hypothetical protein
MADALIDYVARFSDLIMDVVQKRQLLAELQKELEPLARYKLVAVGGEINQLDGLQRLLDQALTKISALRQEQEHDQVDEQISQIKEALTDPRWEVADEIKAELRRKAGQQQEIIQQFQTRLEKWSNLLAETRMAITSAVSARAPVRQQEIELRSLEAQVLQAPRAFLEGRHANLQTLLEQLDQSPAANPDYLARIREETAKTGLFLRQADLLLLRSPLDTRSLYHYTVLLRTPGEPGAHGINILHASCVLVKQDRDEMSASMEQIIAAVNRGVTRDFAARLSTFKAPPPMDGTSSPAASATASGVVATSLPNAGPPAANFNDLVQDLGDLMYRIFVPDRLQNYLYESPCSLTITTNDLELPWELMSYKDKQTSEENKFLCLERPVARMLMGRYLPRRRRSVRAVRKQLSFLLIYADPWANLAFAKREVEKIETALRSQWGEQIAIRVLSGPQASGRELTKVLRQDTYDVIHFAGHAFFDDYDGDLSGLLLHNGELLLAQKVRLLLAGQPLVFLNASPSGCTANEEAPQQIDRYLQGPAEGLASAFIYGGALGCVSSLWPIYDEPAADFAIHFYNHVVSGYMVGEALRLARCKIKQDYNNQITWAAYVLYGDPTLQL